MKRLLLAFLALLCFIGQAAPAASPPQVKILLNGAVNPAKGALLYSDFTTGQYNQVRTRTNGIPNSAVSGGSAPSTAPTGWTIPVMAGITPTLAYGSSVVNGVTVPWVDATYNGTPNATGTSVISLISSYLNAPAAANGQVWTLSTYLALSAGATTNVGFIQLRISEYDSGGSQLSSSASSTFTPNIVGPLARYPFTRTFTQATAARAMPFIIIGLTSGSAVNFTLRIGLPQLEMAPMMSDPISGTGATTSVNETVTVKSVMRTNKVTAWNANPFDLTNVSKAGDAASTLTVVDDSAAIAAVAATYPELAAAATSGRVWKLDNSAGVALATLTFGGTSGTTVQHLGSAYLRWGAGSGRLQVSGGTGSAAVTSSSTYTRQSFSTTSATSAAQLQLSVNVGAVAYIILPQWEEGALSAPMVTYGAQRSVGGIADLYGYQFTRSGAVAYTLDASNNFAATAAGIPVINSAGYLPYQAITNLSTQAVTPSDVSWVSTAVTPTTGQIDPFGGSTAVKAQADGTNTSHTNASPSVSFTTTTAYVFNRLVKPIGGTTRIQLFTASAPFGTTSYANFGLTGAGSVLAQGAGATSAGILALSNGWYWIWFVATSTSSNSGGVGLGFITGDSDARSPTNTSTDAVYTTGAQVYAGTAFFPVLVLTTTASATRGQDALSLYGTTYVAPFTPMAKANMSAIDGTIRAMISMSDATSSNRVMVRRDNTNNVGGYNVVATTSYSQTASGRTGARPMKDALRVRSTAIRFAADGALVSASDTATNPSSSPWKVDIGNDNGGSVFNSPITQFGIYGDVTDTQLMRMTQ